MKVISALKDIFSIIILFIFFYNLVACSKPEKPVGMVAMLSISSDGRYVLSSHHGNTLWLWDIQNRSQTKITDKANIFSPYFVKHSDLFIWQTLDNIVHRKHLSGKKELRYRQPGFPVYGHVLSQDERHYFASDEEFNIYHIVRFRKQIIKPADNSPGYIGAGKLLDLTLANDDSYLLSGAYGMDEDDSTLEKNIRYELIEDSGTSMKYSSWAGVMLWNALSGKAEHQLGGNVSKTSATLSPDGRYVVAGDENGGLFTWDARTGKKLHDLYSIRFGRIWRDKKDPRVIHTDTSGLIPAPKDFCWRISSYDCPVVSHINAVKFINKDQYLRFTTGVPYAILYDVLNPKPLKYLKLEKPANVYGYMVSNRTDTAPDVGILVMASAKSNGIVVYQYDKQEQSLKKIWAPIIENS